MESIIREANSLEVFAEDDQNYLRNFITLFNGTKVICSSSLPHLIHQKVLHF